MPALLRLCWTYGRKQLVSTHSFQCSLVLLLTLGKFKTSSDCEMQQLGDYLRGFQPSALLTFCNTASKRVWLALCHWLYLLHFVLLWGRERDGIWVQLPESIAMTKPSILQDQTQTDGLVQFVRRNKVSLVKLSSKALFVVGHTP